MQDTKAIKLFVAVGEKRTSRVRQSLSVVSVVLAGILGLAVLHPLSGRPTRSATNRYFFVYYTNPSGNIEIARYQPMPSDPNLADPATRTVLLTIPHPI